MMQIALRKWCIALGFVAFLFTHCLFLDRIPGIHFDEAWAAFFSHQIALGQIGIPLEAMSPYTFPWSHFVSALFFKLFSTSLLIDRFSGIFLSFLGIYFVWRTLEIKSKDSHSQSAGIFRNASCVFPWIAAFFLPLILNHRFAIEITTVQVFCFGLLTYGLVQKKHLWIGVSLFIGITSHILFVAIALATWLARRLKTTPFSHSERILTCSLCLALAPFLIRVFFKIPEHDKAIALLILDGFILLDTFFPQLGNLVFLKFKKGILSVAVLLSIPAILFTMVFSEGHWNILFNYGWIAHPEWIGLSWAVLLGGTVYGVIYHWSKFKGLIWPKDLLVWLCLVVLLILLTSTKPTARYYEAGFIGFAILASLSLGALPQKSRLAIVFLFIGLSSLQLWINYFQIGLEQRGQDRSFSFLILHDNSSDFLAKQDLVRFLGSQGCGLNNVKTPDPRLMEALRFLSIGDWKVEAGTCRFKNPIINRKAQALTPAPGSTRLAEVGSFVIDSEVGQ